MRPPCEVIVSQVLPSFRFLVAKQLVEKHRYSQTDAAKRVGTTQAAISQYFYSKRGRRWSSQSKLLSAIRPFAVSVADEIAKGKLSMVDTVEVFCALCAHLKRGVVCGIHRNDALLPKTCAVCKPAIGAPSRA